METLSVLQLKYTNLLTVFCTFMAHATHNGITMAVEDWQHVLGVRHIMHMHKRTSKPTREHFNILQMSLV